MIIAAIYCCLGVLCFVLIEKFWMSKQKYLNIGTFGTERDDAYFGWALFSFFWPFSILCVLFFLVLTVLYTLTKKSVDKLFNTLQKTTDKTE